MTKLTPRAGHWMHFCSPYQQIMETRQDVCPICRKWKHGDGDRPLDLIKLAEVTPLDENFLTKVITDAMIEFNYKREDVEHGIQLFIAKRIVEAVDSACGDRS